MSADFRKRIYDLYLAYAAGRLDVVLNNFDDNVDFVSYAPVDVFPFLGRKKGKAELASTMLKAHAEFEYLSYQPVYFVGDKEDAAIILLTRFKQRRTGRIIQLFIAHFLRFRDDRIVEMREFMDSFDAVEQLLGREIDLSKV